MSVSQAAIISKRSDINIMVILYINVAARKPILNIPINEATTARRKTDASMLANKMATASKKSDTNKAHEKVDISKVAGD